MCCNDRFVDHQIVSNLARLFVACWLWPVHALFASRQEAVPVHRCFWYNFSFPHCLLIYLFVCLFVCLLVGWLVGWLVDWFVG